MTWRKESDPAWPDTNLFQSWDDWVRDEMLPAAKKAANEEVSAGV